MAAFATRRKSSGSVPPPSALGCRRVRLGLGALSCSRGTPRAGPSEPEPSSKAADVEPEPRPDAAFTARLTIDVTPELRGRIKVAAFRRGVTVAEMLRALLAREFPPQSGDLP